jgi:hypothetical protein
MAAIGVEKMVKERGTYNLIDGSVELVNLSLTALIEQKPH